MKQKLFTILTLLLCLCSTAWADDYYTPTDDEVIYLKDAYAKDASTAGYSKHSAVSWGGTQSSTDKKAGDPSNGGAATSSNVKCWPVKGGNTTNKQITVTISGCSKLTVYHESRSDRYYKADITPSSGSISSEKSSYSTYYTEIDLDGTKSYTLVFHGYNNSDEDADFYLYAFKLTKYVAKEISTQGLKSDNAVKVNGTALTKDAETSGYSVSGTTITLSNDQVAYSTPSNIKLVNHITYTDETTEDKDVAATFDGTVTSGYYIGTATVGGTAYTVRVPKGTEAITAVKINGTAISATNLSTLQTEHAVSIDGSALNGIGLISVTLNSGTATVTRTNTGNNAVFTFTCNATEHTVTVTNVKKTYTVLGDPVYYSKNNVNVAGAESKSVNASGITFTYPSKTFSYGSPRVTIGSDSYQPLKLSTGEATTVTFPEGVKATKVRVYGWSVGGDGKMYAIQETSDASGKKVDADQLAADIYYATNTDKDIYPSVYEYELDDWESMYFNAGGSASQPFIVMDFELKDTRTTVGAQTLTWVLNVNSEDSSIKTNSKSSTSTSLPAANMENIANNGLTISKSKKSDLTSKIQAPTAYDADKYMYATFKVADGCRFTPTSISVKIQPVDAKGDVKLVLTDGVNSIEKTQSDVASGSIATITESNSGKTTLTGTVTLKIYCYGSSTGTYRLGTPITIAGTMEQWIPATISAAEYATFYNADKALDFTTTGITVYTAEDKETSVGLNVIESGKVPANTPVVLYKAGADGTAINVPVIASAAAIEGTNDLRVSTGTDVDYMYVLAMNPTIGFYPWTGTNLPAGKIYLQGKASYGARSFIGFDSNTTTSIDNVVVKTIDENAPMYNLAGQRVNKNYKGVVIVNGKKYMNK